MNGRDTVSEQQKEQKIQVQSLKPKQKLRAVCHQPKEHRKQKYKQIKKSPIRQRLSFRLNEDFQKIYNPHNIPYLNCVKCTYFLPQNLQPILDCPQTELTPFLILLEEEYRQRINFLICALANHGGGNIIIINEYENYCIREGFPSELIERFQLVAQRQIQNFINAINGSRYIQNEIHCIQIQRREQFALIITIKVDQQHKPTVFSYQSICYIIVKKYQFQVSQGDENIVKENQLRHRNQIICKCITGFKILREIKLLSYQIPNAIHNEPQNYFQVVCLMVLKYIKKSDLPKIDYKHRAIILKIHEDHGQDIIKLIKQIFKSANIDPIQYFPARELQNIIKEFKRQNNPRAFYYQLWCLVFPNKNFNYLIFQKQLKKLRNIQPFVQCKLFQKSIVIRESLRPNQIQYLFKALKQVFNFQPIRNRHYLMTNKGHLKQMMNMKMRISFLVALILNSGNKTIFS